MRLRTNMLTGKNQCKYLAQLLIILLESHIKGMPCLTIWNDYLCILAGTSQLYEITDWCSKAAHELSYEWNWILSPKTQSVEEISFCLVNIYFVSNNINGKRYIRISSEGITCQVCSEDGGCYTNKNIWPLFQNTHVCNQHNSWHLTMYLSLLVQSCRK